MSDQLSPQQKEAREIQKFLSEVMEYVPVVKYAARAVKLARDRIEKPPPTFEEMFFPTSNKEKK